MSQMSEDVARHGISRSDHREAFVETAAALGAKVCRDAMWANGRCNWIGPAMEPMDGTWRQVYKVFGPDLYGGTSGVALALATLYKSTGERVYRKTALGAMNHALGRAEDIEPHSRMGLYSGWFGIAIAGLRAARLLDDQSTHDRTVRMVERLEELPPDTSNCDLLAGCAGAIIGLLVLNGELSGDNRFVEAAMRFGEAVVGSAIQADTGWSWGDLHKPESGAFGNLTGYSHGAAGIGLALLELSRITGEARFQEAGQAGFRHERHWFDPEKGNWPDLRNPELSGGSRTDAPSFMNAWCHGAPGIALSRLRSYQILACDTCRQEAEIAIDTTVKNLYGNSEMSQNNHSLCHGMGGNSEPLIYGAEVLGKPELFTRAEEVALAGIDTYAAKRITWACGGPGGLETAGLMLGLAGIAYFYLRMADPLQTPSVLIFTPAA